MFIYIFCIVVISFMATIGHAIRFGQKKKTSNLVDVFINLGFAIWGLILIVLNWS